MDVIKNRSSLVKTIDNTYDNTQRLIKNVIESLKRFNKKDNAQKMRTLFSHKIRSYLWTGFFIFGVILVINVVIMTFYLVDSGYNYNLMEDSYINAVLPSQDIGGKMDLGIVNVVEAKYSELSIGDQVVVYGDFSLDVHWVETIVSIDQDNNNIELTYDNVSTNTYHIEQVVGQYTEKANFLGTVYYASTYLQGYIFVAMSHILLMIGYWYAFLSNRNTGLVNESSLNYKEQMGILNGIDADVLSEALIPLLKDLEKTKVIEDVKTVTLEHKIKSKGDIINYITADTGLSNYKGKKFLKYFGEVITEELSKGNDIHIIRFGKFTTVTMPEKCAVNPQSNEKIIVPEHKQVRVRFYNEVKNKL